MKWRTLIWISCFIATCLIKSSSGRGVLTIWLLNYKNVKGRTYDGKCCDEAPFGSKTCPDQCDYVMRCIVTGLGRANDHVFLFHRPIKYDSNDISFEGESSKMSQLTVLFDEWPSSGNVKMDVFFYDYDDFDHTTVLVDWFETPLRRTVDKGERQIEVVRGSRQLDKTILEFKWTVHCFGLNDCLSPPPEWHKWPWHPEDRTPLLFDSSKNIPKNTTHSSTTWRPNLKTSTVKIYNQDKINGWEDSKHHWADNSIWLNQSPFLPFHPVRPNPRTTIDDREILVDVKEHARIIDAEERQDLPEIPSISQNENVDSITSSQLKKGPDHRKHRRKKIELPKQKSITPGHREQTKTVDTSNNENIDLTGLIDPTPKTTESKNELRENKDTPDIEINQFQSIQKGSLEKKSLNVKSVIPLMPLEHFGKENGVFMKNQNDNNKVGNPFLENSIRDVIRETEIKAGAVQNKVRNPFIQEPYKSIHEFTFKKSKTSNNKRTRPFERSTESPVDQGKAASDSTKTEVRMTYLKETGLPEKQKSIILSSETTTIKSPKENRQFQNPTESKVVLTTSVSSETIESINSESTKSENLLVTKSYEDSDITSIEGKTILPNGKVTQVEIKNDERNATQSFPVRTTDIPDPNKMKNRTSSLKNINQSSIQSTSPFPQDVFLPMAMNVPVRLSPKQMRPFDKKSKAMENINPFTKPEEQRNYIPTKMTKVNTKTKSSSISKVMKQTTTPISPKPKLNKNIILQRRPSTRKWDKNYNWKKHYKDFVLPRKSVPRVRPSPAVWTQPPPVRGRQNVNLSRQHIGINQTGAKRYPKEILNKLLQERKNSDIDYGYYRDKHNEFIINHNKRIREEKRKNRLAAKEPKRTYKKTKHWRKPKRPPLRSPFTPAPDRSRNRKVKTGNMTNVRKGKIMNKSKEKLSLVKGQSASKESNRQIHSIQSPSLELQDNGSEVNTGINDAKEIDTKLEDSSSPGVLERRRDYDDKDSFIKKSPFTPPSVRDKTKQKVSTVKSRAPVNPVYLERQTRLPYRGSLVPGQGFTDWSSDLVTQKAPINPKTISRDVDHSQNGGLLAKKAPLPQGKKSWLKPNLASRDPHLVDVPIFSHSQRKSEFQENEGKLGKSNKQTFDFDVASFLSQPKELVHEINQIAKNTNVMFNISEDTKFNSLQGNKLLISVEDRSSMHTKTSSKNPLTPSSKKIESPFSSWTRSIVATSSSNTGILTGKPAEPTSSFASNATEAIKSYSHKTKESKQKNYPSHAFTKSTEVSSKTQTFSKMNNINSETKRNKIKSKRTQMNSRKYTSTKMNNQSIAKSQKRNNNSKIEQPKRKMNQSTVRDSRRKMRNGYQKTATTKTMNNPKDLQSKTRWKLKPQMKSTTVTFPGNTNETPSRRTKKKLSTESMSNSNMSKTKQEMKSQTALRPLKPVIKSPFHPKRKGKTNKIRRVNHTVGVSTYSTSPKKMTPGEAASTHKMNIVNVKTYSKAEESSKIPMFTTLKGNKVEEKNGIIYPLERTSSTPEPVRTFDIKAAGYTSQPVLSIAITPTKPTKQTHHVVNIPLPPHSENVKTTGGPQIPGVISSDVYHDKTDDIFTINTPVAVLTPASHNQRTTTASYRHQHNVNKVTPSSHQTNGQLVFQNKARRKFSKKTIPARPMLKTTPFARSKNPKSNHKMQTSVFSPFTKLPEMTSYSTKAIKTFSPTTIGSDQAVSPPTLPRRFTPNNDQLLQSFKILDDLTAKAAKNNYTDKENKLQPKKTIKKNYISERTTGLFNQNLETTPQTTARFTMAPLTTKYSTPSGSTRKSTMKSITRGPRVKFLNPFVTPIAPNVGSKRPEFKSRTDEHTTLSGIHKGGKSSNSLNTFESPYMTELTNFKPDKDLNSDSVTEGKMNVFEFLPNAMKDIYFGKSQDSLGKNKHSTHNMKTGSTTDYQSTSYTTKASPALRSNFNDVPHTLSKGIHVSSVTSFNEPTGKTAIRNQPQPSFPDMTILSSATTIRNKMQVDDDTPLIRNPYKPYKKGNNGKHIFMENNPVNIKEMTSRKEKDIKLYRNRETDTITSESEVPNFVYHESKKDKKFVNFLFRDKETGTRMTSQQVMLSRRQPTSQTSVRPTIVSRKEDAKSNKRGNNLHQSLLTSIETSGTTTEWMPSKHVYTGRVRNQGDLSSSLKMTDVSTLPAQSIYYTRRRTNLYSTVANSNVGFISGKDKTSTVSESFQDLENQMIQNIRKNTPKVKNASQKITRKETMLFQTTYPDIDNMTSPIITKNNSSSDVTTTNGVTPKRYSTSANRNNRMSTRFSKPTGTKYKGTNYARTKSPPTEVKSITTAKVSTESTTKFTHITDTQDTTSGVTSSPTKKVTDSNQSSSSSQTRHGGTATTVSTRTVNVLSDNSKKYSNIVKNESTNDSKEPKMNTSITSDIFKWIYDISKSIPNSLFSNKIKASENLTKTDISPSGSSQATTEILNSFIGSSTFSPKLTSISKILDVVRSKNNTHETLSEVSTTQFHATKVQSTEETIPGRNFGKTYSSSTVVTSKDGSGLTSKATVDLPISKTTNMETSPTSTTTSPTLPLSIPSSTPSTTTLESTVPSTRKTTKTSTAKTTITSSTLTTPKKIFLTLPPWLKLPDLLKPASSTALSTSTTEIPTTTSKTTKKSTTSKSTKKKTPSTKSITTANFFPVTKYNNPVTKTRKPVNITINRSPDANYGPRIIIPNGGLYIPSEGTLNGTDGFLHSGVVGSSGARNLRLHGRKMNFKTVFSRYWPAILGLTVGTVFLVAAVLTSVACRQQRLYIRRTGWTDMPHHVSEPPDTSEYSSAASLVSDATRSSISFR